MVMACHAIEDKKIEDLGIRLGIKDWATHVVREG
jgi:hypothetical protein